MIEKPPIRLTAPGRFKREAELDAVMERHGIAPGQPFDFSECQNSYHAMQIDRPCYFDLWIECQDDAKVAPLIRELAALGLEVELSDADAEAITDTVQ